MKLNKVLVFGGTHGNEWTGIYLVNKYGDELKKEFRQLDVEFILANPEAYKINKRFKDEDLNRAFLFLNENRPHSFEHQRARELQQMIKTEPCFVIDLHTTTSNMGNTIIITHENSLNFFIAKKIAENLKDTRIILSPDNARKYLASQSDFGMMIEVGPVANGVIEGTTLENSKRIIKEILGQLSTLPNLTSGTLEIYEEIEDIFYPQKNGELAAYIHRDFQGKDFVALNGEYAPFSSFEGKEIKMHTKEELFPIFINEAAYYPTKLAFTLCRKRSVVFDAE